MSAECWTIAGAALGALGLAVGVACLVVAFLIYKLQKGEAEKAQREQKAHLESVASEIESGMRALLASARHPVTAELDTEIKRFATASASAIIGVPAPLTVFVAPLDATVKTNTPPEFAGEGPDRSVADYQRKRPG